RMENINSGSQEKRRGRRKQYVLPMKKNCIVCGGEFWAQTRYQAVRNKYCSKDCRRKGNPYYNRGRKPPEERPGLVKINCSVCGKEVWKPKAWVKRIQNPVCSRECNGKLRIQATFGADRSKAWTEERKQQLREKMKGENNPSWKGGVTLRRSKGNYK